MRPAEPAPYARVEQLVATVALPADVAQVFPPERERFLAAQSAVLPAAPTGSVAVAAEHVVVTVVVRVVPVAVVVPDALALIAHSPLLEPVLLAESVAPRGSLAQSAPLLDEPESPPQSAFPAEPAWPPPVRLACHDSPPRTAADSAPLPSIAVPVLSSEECAAHVRPRPP